MVYLCYEDAHTHLVLLPCRHVARIGVGEARYDHVQLVTPDIFHLRSTLNPEI